MDSPESRREMTDADTVAGWRRVAPSLGQLHHAIADLRSQHPDVTVAVVADASIKWALPADEQPAFEQDIVTRAVVCAPAGTRDGTYGWMLAVVERARRDAERVLVVTDRALGGVSVVRLTHAEGHFRFDLDGATVQGIPIPESVLGPAMRSVGRDYPALTETGRDLFIQIPADGKMKLMPGAVLLIGPPR